MNPNRDAAIEAGAIALRESFLRITPRRPWGELPDVIRERYRAEAESVLAAAIPVLNAGAHEPGASLGRKR